jgi:hypothetical protein
MSIGNARGEQDISCSICLVGDTGLSRLRSPVYSLVFSEFQILRSLFPRSAIYVSLLFCSGVEKVEQRLWLRPTVVYIFPFFSHTALDIRSTLHHQRRCLLKIAFLRITLGLILLEKKGTVHRKKGGSRRVRTLQKPCTPRT